MNRSILCIFFTSLLLLLTISSPAVAQQKGIVQGKVTKAKGEPLANINVALQGTNLGDASDEQGYYKITSVPAGTYVFRVSSIGYSSEQESITITAGNTLTVNVQLSPANQQLQEIVVKGSTVNKFNTEQTDYVAKVPLKDINNPQVYNTITSDLLTDQVITDFQEVFKNAPGVFKLWESTGRGGDGAGYYSLRGFSTQPQMVNGLPSLTNGSPDPINIERIEIIKGPSATLFGSSVTSYGGLINVVTKKPYEVTGGEISYKTGSFGMNRVTADVNTPINDNVFLRVNTAYQKRNSFLNAGFSESFFIAPSLRYEANEDLSFYVNTEFYRPESTNPLMLFLNRSAPLEANNVEELGYNHELSYTTNDLTIKNPTFSLQGQMNYDISDEWRSQTVISSSSAQSEGYYSYVSTIGLPEDTYGRYISDQNSTTNGLDVQQNFIGDFNLGSVNNSMVVGLDFFQQRVTNNSTGYIGYDAIDINNPNPPAISKAAVDTLLASAPVASSETEQQVYSAYVSDVIEFIPQISAMASLRVDHFVNEGNVSTGEDDFNQTTLSPKFGLIFKPIPERLSLFANYMNGFNNVAPIQQGDGSIETFDPEQANQWEVGVKTNFFNGLLNATASYYNITVSNILRQDPNRPNFVIQDGENFSRGVELSITASPAPGLNIIAGYSHNQSEITKTDNENLLGRRPERAGPQDLINGWISYRFTNGPLHGFGIGFGGNYASENYTINRANTGRFTLPAYTVLNSSLFYNTDSYRLDLKINNLTDETYYNGWSTVNPQAPRNVTVSFSYKF